MAAEDDGGLPGVERMRHRELAGPARLAELHEGRVFEHRSLTDPSNAGPQFCRIVGWTDERVSFHEVHRRPDGTDREPRVAPWRVPVRSFFEFDLGRWHDGPLPPAASASSGYHLPLSTKKPGTSGPGHS